MKPALEQIKAGIHFASGMTLILGFTWSCFIRNVPFKFNALPAFQRLVTGPDLFKFPSTANAVYDSNQVSVCDGAGLLQPITTS